WRRSDASTAERWFPPRTWTATEILTNSLSGIHIEGRTLSPDVFREVLMLSRAAPAATSVFFSLASFAFSGVTMAQAPTCAQRSFGAPGAAPQQGGRDPGQPPEPPQLPQGTPNVRVLSHIPLPGMAN